MPWPCPSCGLTTLRCAAACVVPAAAVAASALPANATVLIAIAAAASAAILLRISYFPSLGWLVERRHHRARLSCARATCWDAVGMTVGRLSSAAGRSRWPARGAIHAGDGEGTSERFRHGA